MANLKPRADRPVVRWHGGKWVIAPWVIEHFPRHHLYTEAFGGGASVLLRKWQSPGEVYNDLDMVLVKLFRVLRDPDLSARLVQALALTPYARDEFWAAYECAGCGQPVNDGDHDDCDADPVEVARRTVVRSFQGYGSDGTGGKYRTGFRATVSSTDLKMPAQEWVTYPEALWRNAQRLRRVSIENVPAVEIFERFDGPATLHYVDPPYLPSTRSAGNRRRGQGFHVYAHELDESDHVQLLETVLRLKGMVVLSGYPSDLYDAALTGWSRVERAAYADGGGARTEVIWINPSAQTARLTGKSPRRKVAGHPGPLFKGEENEDDTAPSSRALGDRGRKAVRSQHHGGNASAIQ